jgi:hypothetical protein
MSSPKVKNVEVVQAKQEAVRSEHTVLAMLYNSAHPIISPSDREKLPVNRDNTPWVVIIPELGVTSTVVDKDGDPLVGRIEPGYGLYYAFQLYTRLMREPELLVAYQTNNDMPELEKGYTGKLIPLTFQA